MPVFVDTGTDYGVTGIVPEFTEIELELYQNLPTLGKVVCEHLPTLDQGVPEFADIGEELGQSFPTLHQGWAMVC